MYAEDSFFTLNMPSQIGLVFVSLVLAAIALGATRLLVWHRPVVLRAPVWFVVFVSFVWLSPQGYYTYYRLIIDGLPKQSVLGPLPPPEDLLGLMTFTGPVTLAAHATGVLGWVMLLAAFWPQRRKRRSAAD